MTKIRWHVNFFSLFSSSELQNLSTNKSNFFFCTFEQETQSWHVSNKKNFDRKANFFEVSKTTGSSTSLLQGILPQTPKKGNCGKVMLLERRWKQHLAQLKFFLSYPGYFDVCGSCLNGTQGQGLRLGAEYKNKMKQLQTSA